MSVKKQMLSGSIAELTIEQDAANVAKFRKKVIADLSANTDVKGFRKGAQIPENVIVQQFGEERIAQMTVEKAIEGLYRDTLRSEKLMPVAQAEITNIESQDPLIVKIQVEVFPAVEIKDSYKKVKLTKDTLSVSAGEVKAALEDIQTRFTHFHDVTDKKRSAKMGDKLTVDTQGFDEKGEVLESTQMQDYPLVLGSNLLVPGFEEDMVGMKLGETKDIDVTFPDDYHNVDFAGKKTKFTVTVKKFEHAHKPEFTPEFIKELRGQDLDLDGFKALIKTELLETKEMNDAMQREMKLIDELLKHATLDIGEKMLAQQTDQVFEEIKQNIAKDGIKAEDYIASLGLDEASYKEKHVKETALKRLQGELILSKLLEMEKVEMSDEDMDKEVKQVMSRFESEDVLKRLTELYVPGSKYYEELKRRAMMRKLIDGFFEEKKSTKK